MASPIAASAAATVSVSIAKICPEISLIYAEKAIKLIFTDNKMSSIDIKIIIKFFLFKNIPKTPKVKIIAPRKR
jgi:hypothetical protein